MSHQETQEPEGSRAYPQFNPEEAEQIRDWARANGYGGKSFTRQVGLAALHGSRDYAKHAEEAAADAR